MKVAMMQPSFMPWQGFFELIYSSDIFIFLDDFQFSVQSYHQRNRLFVNIGQVDWYSVPVQKSVSFKSPLNQTKINETTPWRAKMWKRLQQNYSKTPYYSQIAPLVEKWLLDRSESLAAQNIVFIRLVCDLLAFQREFRLSSQCPSDQQRSKRVIELLRWCKAHRYLCAKGSFAYMREGDVFPVDDIEVLFQDFQPKPYNQRGAKDNFVPYLSVLDALLNVGPEKTSELIRNGTPRWLTWESMVQESSASHRNNEEVPEENHE
jgi:hypothetical protein